MTVPVEERARRLRLVDSWRRRDAEQRPPNDRSRSVALMEAYWAGAPYRLAVMVTDPKNDRAYLSLAGARHLRKRLDAAIRRLEARRPARATRRFWCSECGDDAPRGICAACQAAKDAFAAEAESDVHP